MLRKADDIVIISELIKGEKNAAYILLTASKQVAEGFHISTLTWLIFTSITAINMRSYVPMSKLDFAKQWCFSVCLTCCHEPK